MYRHSLILNARKYVGKAKDDDSKERVEDGAGGPLDEDVQGRVVERSAGNCLEETEGVNEAFGCRQVDEELVETPQLVLEELVYRQH